VDHLRGTGRWERSVLLVLADHSMDFSLPTATIPVNRLLAPRPDRQASIVITQSSGADLPYWTGSAAHRDAGLSVVRRLVQAHPGVLSGHVPGSLRPGREAGDLVAHARPGWRLTAPEPTANPIPGNHGHPATEPIPFLLSGGHPALRGRGTTSGAPARTVDVAPMVGAMFGLAAPASGHDSAPRREAFVALPLR